jgi:hypothetical protein
MSREVMQLALDALEGAPIDYDFHGSPMTDDEQNILNAIEALKAELAKPEPEPIGFVSPEFIWDNQAAGNMVAIYRKEDV